MFFERFFGVSELLLGSCIVLIFFLNDQLYSLVYYSNFGIALLDFHVMIYTFHEH